MAKQLIFDETARRSLKRGVDKLADAVRQLAFELQHDRDMSARDREYLLLRLENALLRFERRLPPAGERDQGERESAE